MTEKVVVWAGRSIQSTTNGKVVSLISTGSMMTEYTHALDGAAWLPSLPKELTAMEMRLDAQAKEVYVRATTVETEQKHPDILRQRYAVDQTSLAVCSMLEAIAEQTKIALSESCRHDVSKKEYDPRLLRSEGDLPMAIQLGRSGGDAFFSKDVYSDRLFMLRAWHRPDEFVEDTCISKFAHVSLSNTFTFSSHYTSSKPTFVETEMTRLQSKLNIVSPTLVQVYVHIQPHRTMVRLLVRGRVSSFRIPDDELQIDLVPNILARYSVLRYHNGAESRVNVEEIPAPLQPQPKCSTKRRRLVGHGLHPKLETVVDVTKALDDYALQTGSDVRDRSECVFVLFETLPASVVVDQDDLHIARDISTDFWLTTESDIEKPAQYGQQNTAAIVRRQTFAQISNSPHVAFQLPIHLRYQPPQVEETVSIPFFAPSLYGYCYDSQAEEPLCASPASIECKHWSRIALGQMDPIEARIPVGQVHHQTIVDLGTFISTLVATYLICKYLLALYRQPRKLD